MKKIQAVKVLKQFNLRFKYADQLFIRAFIVPEIWSFKEMEKYLRKTFNKKDIHILNHRQVKVYAIQENLSKSRVNKADTISEYWNDGLQRDIGIKLEDEWIVVNYITDTKITVESFVELLKKLYPYLLRIEMLYQAECLIKNDCFECDDLGDYR